MYIHKSVYEFNEGLAKRNSDWASAFSLLILCWPMASNRIIEATTEIALKMIIDFLFITREPCQAFDVNPITLHPAQVILQ